MTTKKAILVIIIFIAVIILAPLVFRPNSAIAPAKDGVQTGDVPVIGGNEDDLVSFSIKHGQEVSGVVKATGVLKGGYFFEGNIPITILDANQNPTNYGPGHATATTDWMTTGPVSFEVFFDFTKIPKGKAFIKITPDDPRDVSEKGDAMMKQILIPIVVK